ncbi:MAG: VWA domain-containing protein [Porticoccaceae bacterium]
MIEFIENFHFLRPHWLWAVIAIPALLFWQRHKTRSQSGWQQIIAPAILPLLTQSSGGKSRFMPLLATLLIGLTVGAAGPTWQRLPQPVEINQSALVVILDLSPSLYAKDIAPSRLVRARFKLLDLLNQRRDGLTALVVYAGQAHVLSPLTEDNNTIAHLVPILSPSLLLEIGSNLEDAIDQALILLQNGAEGRGDIILITDGATANAARTSSEILNDHSAVRLSILGVGTASGAPIPLADGGFLKAADGAIVLPKLNSAVLADLASRHRGIYRTLSADDSDTNALLEHIDSRATTASKPVERDFDQWRDTAHWVALLLLLPMALCFRRGLLAVTFFLLLPATHTPSAFAQAAETDSTAPSLGERAQQQWQDLWWRRDQQAAAKLAEGDASTAAQLFERSDWAGTAAYRNGDYNRAVEYFLADPESQYNPTALYNAATALARSGELETALATYNQLLAQQPEHTDGRYNRDIVERALQQQQQQEKEQQQQENQQENQQQSEQHDQNQQSQSEDQAGDNQQNQQQPDADSRAQQQNQPQNGEQDQPSGDQPDQQKPAEQESAEQPSEQQSDQAAQGEQGESNEQSEESAQLNAANSDQQQESDRELEQWLRKIDDDPAGLLRAKFRYQSQQRAREQKLRPPPSSDQSERW